MNRLTALCLTLCACAAFGQVAADAGVDGGSLEVPDASVGQGGADRDNEEGEDGVGRTTAFCRNPQDCDRGFGCEAGRCRYVGFRKAERVGCLFGPEATLALGLLALGLRKKG